MADDAKAQPGGSPEQGGAGGPKAPQSLQEAIAKRRAQLKAEVADRKAGGAGVSLQDVLSRKRKGDKKKGRAAPAASGKAPQAAGEAAAAPPAASPPADEPPQPPHGEADSPPAERAETPAAAIAPAPAVERQGRPAMAAAAASAAPARPGAVVVAGRQPLAQAVLWLNTFLLAGVGGVLVYVLANRTTEPTAAEGALKVVRDVERDIERRAASATQPAARADANKPPAPAVAVAFAPSWASADTAYVRKDYNNALALYSRLLLASRRLPSEALAGEFFQYRICRSVWQLGRLEQARSALARLQHSGSAIIRAAANADVAQMDEMAGQHLGARMLACRALSALAAIEESFALEADCDYLVARAVTEKVRSYHTTEPRVPWSRLRMSDVFSGRDEAGIRRLLDCAFEAPGTRRPEPVVRIRKTTRGWSLAVRGGALEDVLHQFAARTGRDVRWHGVPPAVRRRALSFVFREVSEQRVCELACGMAGLVGRFTWDELVVCDPDSLTTLSDQRELLGSEGISAWRRFSLRFADDPRVPEGQFALGALYEFAGDTVAAMKQYQLVGRQYHNEPELAPKAMMRSAELRISGLRDYAGAQNDLQDLLDLHPHYRRIDQVYLSLGRACLQAGNLDEAVRAFTKLQDLDVPDASRRAACLELGDCHFRQKAYQEASKWLSRYLAADKDGAGTDGVRAYLLLGRSEAAQGHRAAAAAAFRRVLAARPPRDEYVEAVVELAQVQTDMGDYAGALATIRRIEEEKLSDLQRYRFLMTVSKLYRAVGLPDRARAFLRKAGAAVEDGQMRARIAAEQARCLREAGDLRAARDVLSEVLGRLKGGRATREVSLDLAETCLDMGDAEQAAVLAGEALRGTCPEKLRRRGLEVLGRAHLRRKQYEQAARALADLGALATGRAGGAEGEGR